MGERMRAVTLYSRPGCDPCEHARAVLRALRGAGVRFELRDVNVDGNAELERRFGERVPVIELDGVEVASAPLDLAAVRRALCKPRSDGGG